MNRINRFIKILYSMVFPPICVSCKERIGNEEIVLCAPCTKNIILHDSLFCPICGARVPPGAKVCHSSAGYTLAAATSYEQKTIRDLVHALKYDETKEGAMLIAYVIFEYLKRILPLSSLNFSDYAVIPIPLYTRKERARGYNQSSLIAQELKLIFETQGMAFPKIYENILIRNTHTLSQTECHNIQERRKNISGCFTVLNKKNIEQKNIILVDDVHTTGATIGEATRMVKQCGVKHVLALTFAKT